MSAPEHSPLSHLSRGALIIVAVAAPLVALASGAEAEHSGPVTPPWPELGQHFGNLLLYAAILFFFAYNPIRDALRNRALVVRKGITEAGHTRDAAQARYDELQKRLDGFETEVQRMRADATAEAKAEEEALIARAAAEAERIAQMAEKSIRDESARARVALRKEAVELAVELAEQTLRAQVASPDHQRLANEFLTTLREDEHHG